MKTGSFQLSGLIALMILSTLHFPATALEDNNNLFLEEVLVSARKRKESLQDTPVAVSAFSADSLKELGVSNIKDLNGFVPGLQLIDGTGTGKAALVFIRGVGRREAMVSSDAAILVYIDGVHQWRPEASIIDTLDAESIEVLRGPQGTLFGKNTTAGAILLTSRKPSAQRYTKTRIRVGNYDELDGSVIANTPLIDKSLFAKLTVSSSQHEGYIENIVTGHKLDDEDRLDTVTQLRWLVNEDATWDLAFSTGKRHEFGRAGKCVFTGYDNLQAGLLRGILEATNYENACRESDTLDHDEVRINYEPVFDMDMRSLTSIVEFSLLDFAGLSRPVIKSTSAWINVKANFLDGDQDGSNLSILHTLNRTPYESDQYAQELQLTALTLNGRMNLVAGLFASAERLVDDIRSVTISDGYILQNQGGDVKNESLALYSQASFDLSDSWQLTGGVRYTEEDRELDGYSNIELGGNTIAELDESNKETYYAFTPMINLSWNSEAIVDDSEVLDSLMTYAALSEGFKAGGFTMLGTSSIDPYDQEEVTTFEIGVKIDAFDRRLRFNTAAYISDYSDMQIIVFEKVPTEFIPNVVTRNAGQATMQGFELELTGLVSQNFQVMASAAYIDAYYDEFVGNRTTQSGDFEPFDRSDEPLSWVPEWTAFLALQYMFDTRFGDVSVHLESSFKDNMSYHVDHGTYLTGVAEQGAMTLYNASLTWQLANERTQIQLFGRNLSDKEYINGIAGTVDSLGSLTRIAATPRTYGIEINHTFGDL